MRNALVAILLLLSFFGIADSWYLADHAFSGTELTCDVQGLGECNTVAASAYSWFMGLPLAFYGVIFYAMVFALAAAYVALRTRAIARTLVLVSFIGAVLSVYFLYLQVAVIKAVCMYCLTSAALSFLALVAAVALAHPASRRKLRHATLGA